MTGLKHILIELELVKALLAITDISTVQSSAQTFIHNAVLFIDSFNNAWHLQAHWLIGTPYLSTIASNGTSYYLYDFSLSNQFLSASRVFF